MLQLLQGFKCSTKGAELLSTERCDLAHVFIYPRTEAIDERIKTGGGEMFHPVLHS